MARPPAGRPGPAASRAAHLTAIRLRRLVSLRRALAGLVIALAVVLAALSAAAILGTVSTAREYRDGSQQALARQTAANNVLVTLLSAQTANRGYTLARRGDDLRQYGAATDRYPRSIERLQRVVSGEPELEALVDGVDAAAGAWFVEAVQTLRLIFQDRLVAALDRVNEGVGEDAFRDFRAEHNRLLAQIDLVRRDALAAADERRRLVLAVILGAALLALVVTAAVSFALWRRVGGPVAALAAGVRRVAGGTLTQPVRPSKGSVRELAELVAGFNTMQREVRDERESVAAAARREATQKTERSLWETVQAGLLPQRLAGVPGLRIAARYQPAERALLVGGDFYDAVALPDGRLALMVGDMAGHGAQSAAQAAGLRFGWRTLVAVNPNPAAVLAALNVQMREPDQRVQGLFASILYVLIDPRGGISFAPAGHPAPFLLTAAGCRPLETTVNGPLLGIVDEGHWPVTHAALPPGGTLVLYTDGLVEARRGGGDTFGDDRACGVLEAERRSALETRIERLIDAARRHEDARLRDDVVVLAVERPVAAFTPPPVHHGRQSAAVPSGNGVANNGDAPSIPAPARGVPVGPPSG